MGIFDGLAARFAPSNTTIYIYNNDPVVVDMDLAAIYKTQPNLQAVISYIADNIAQLSLKVYDRVDDSDRARITDSTAARLLKGPINPDMTSFEYVRTLVSDYEIYGRHLDLVFVDEDMPSGYQIRPIPPSWIRDYKGGTAFAPNAIDIQLPDGTYLELLRDDFVLYHSYNPLSPSKALSPVASLRTVLSEQIEAERYRSQVWKRGGRVSSVVTRPKDVETWTPDQRTKFMESLKSAWTGDFGSSAGGLMLLEDGMEIKPYQVNAHEAQWAEAKKLSREDIAAAFHINPSLIWHTDTQTYASAKDNARAFYADAVAPILKQIESRMNNFLLPKLKEPEGHYVEFDISGKLRGSFEEQAQVLYQAVGGPYMTPNEARGYMNLPSLGEQFESIYVPLNMSQVQAGDTPELEEVEELSLEVMTKSEPVQFKATATEEEGESISETFKAFYERQARSILPKLGAKADWWDSDRWNAELTDDLTEKALAIAVRAARDALLELGYSLEYAEETARAFVRAMCADRAEAINDTTYKRLLEALEAEDEDGILSTPEGVFENAIEERAPSNGLTFATALAGFGATDAGRFAKEQTGDRITKTWIHNPSANPRANHVAMAGETVAIDESFSDGSMWPGDSKTTPVRDIVNCHCEVLITRP